MTTNQGCHTMTTWTLQAFKGTCISRHAVLRPDGTLSTPGVSHGPKGLTVVEDLGDRLIIKSHGHTGWSGRGQTSYHGPTYYLMDRATGDFKAEVHEPGRQWRAAIKALKAWDTAH